VTKVEIIHGNLVHMYIYIYLPLRIQRLIAEHFVTLYREQDFIADPLLTTVLLLTLLRVIKKV